MQMVFHLLFNALEKTKSVCNCLELKLEVYSWNYSCSTIGKRLFMRVPLIRPSILLKDFSAIATASKQQNRTFFYKKGFLVTLRIWNEDDLILYTSWFSGI